MHTSRRSLVAAAVMLTAGCLPEHGPLTPTNSTLRLALRVQLQSSTVGERVVEIRARYRRASGDLATLPVQPTQVSIADGVTVQQTVVIDIGPCNADASRAGGGDGPQGCRFTIELTLKNGAGETLSNATKDVGPVGSAPTEPPTFILSTPNLTVAPAALTFSARAQQAMPAAQTVTVNANNTGATLGTIATLIQYTNGQGWLRASIDQGSHTLTIQPTTTALAVGTYRAVVGVSSSVDGMKAQTVPVTYEVAQPPVLTVTGGGGGSGSVTSLPTGISCTITAGGTSGTCSAPFVPNAPVTLTATASGNSTFGGWGGACSGQGACTVTLAQAVTVSATFLPGPVLRLTPTSLAFVGVAGTGGPPRQTVSVVNAGGGTLSGVSITSIRLDGSEPSWLDATLSGSTIVVGATPANLQAGSYSGSIIVGSANGGSATLTVTFVVGAQPPVLRLSPTSLSFSGVSNGPSPARQSVSIVNAGGGTLAGVAVSNISYPATPPALWADATLSGTTLSVGASPAKLPPGNYTATILVVSSNGGNATLSVSIAVAAPPPVLALTPNTLSFGALLNSGLPPAQTVRASNIGFGTFADLGTLSVGANTSSWLRVSFDGDIVVVAPTSTTLGRGTFTGIVTINSTRGGSATISVTYTITFIG